MQKSWKIARETSSDSKHITPTESSQTLTHQGNGATVEVLCQKLGERWFAFSLIDNDIFVGSFTEEQLTPTASPFESL